MTCLLRVRVVRCRSRNRGATCRILGLPTRDRTAVQAATERRELLMAEMNHRIKNTFAMVQGVAAQTTMQAITCPATCLRTGAYHTYLRRFGHAGCRSLFTASPRMSTVPHAEVCRIGRDEAVFVGFAGEPRLKCRIRSGEPLCGWLNIGAMSSPFSPRLESSAPSRSNTSRTDRGSRLHPSEALISRRQSRRPRARSMCSGQENAPPLDRGQDNEQQRGVN